MSEVVQSGSSSIQQPDYWWYRARTDLLQAALGDFLGSPAARCSTSAAPTARASSWMQRRARAVRASTSTRAGSSPGSGVCGLGAGAAVRRRDLRRRRGLRRDRALRPRGPGASPSWRRVLRRRAAGCCASVPAYQWAWSDHDVRAGHHRRYTRRRLVRAVEGAGLTVLRSTYGFAGGLPDVRRRARSPGGCAAGAAAPQGLPQVSPAMDRVLTGLCRAEARLLRSGRPAVRVVGLHRGARSPLADGPRPRLSAWRGRRVRATGRGPRAAAGRTPRTSTTRNAQQVRSSTGTPREHEPDDARHQRQQPRPGPARQRAAVGEHAAA